MKDPVYLPTSKTTVERCNIERHLLQYDEDPFNHEFLTRDMLVSDVELKAEIEDFIKSRKYNSQEQSMESEQSTTNEASAKAEEATYRVVLKGSSMMTRSKKIILSIYPHQEYLAWYPVVLPSNFLKDRATIRNHISKFHVDPFSEIISSRYASLDDDNNKARIKEFITSSEWQSIRTSEHRPRYYN
ncbi:hypothetical protein MKW92_015512 [Papaver armeniacum]|nr:hypothetical protein MKW92_015512 [Papaver armeniacum]